MVVYFELSDQRKVLIHYLLNNIGKVDQIFMEF